MAKIKGSIVVEAAALKAALGNVVGIVESGIMIPILSCVLLKVDGVALDMITSDLDMEAHARAALSEPVSGVFHTCVSARTFAALVGKLPADAQVTLEDVGNKVVMSAGRASFDLPSLPRDDFPAIPEPAWDSQWEAPAMLLARAIDQVRHAISTEVTRYYLNGINLEVLDDGVRFIATDGHRLAHSGIEKPDGALPCADIIIGRKAVGIIARLLDKAAEGAAPAISLSKLKLRFELGGVTLITKLIDGQFPDYRRIIPDDRGAPLRLDPRALAEVIDRVATICSKKTRVVKMVLAPDCITVSATSPENGTAKEELSCAYEGGPLTIGFNAKYLMEVLGKMAGDVCEILCGDPGVPVLIREASAGMLGSVHVLMPLRV